MQDKTVKVVILGLTHIKRSKDKQEESYKKDNFALDEAL